MSASEENMRPRHRSAARHAPDAAGRTFVGAVEPPATISKPRRNADAPVVDEHHLGARGFPGHSRCRRGGRGAPAGKVKSSICRSGGDLRVSRKAGASLATSHAPANPRAAVSAPDRAVAIGRLGRSDVARPRERPLAGRSFPRRRDGCPRRSSRCSPSWSRSKA